MGKAIWANKIPKVKQVDTLYLSSKDINHLSRIYNKYSIRPESLNEVRVDYLLDRHYLIRYIIKELDILLKKGGKFIINSTYSARHANYIRSKSQIKYEFSTSTNGRYRLEKSIIDKNTISLTYVKNEEILTKDDSIERWTFGIITNGKKNHQVVNLIDSINKQKIPYYEILICGDFKYSDKEKYPIISIRDAVIENDIRAPITIKKNRIANKAKYQNMIILHDRYLLPDNWFQKIKKYGNYFDLLTMPNIGPNEGRVNDWGEYLGKPSEIYREVFHFLSYNKWSLGWYSQGGMLIIKKNLYFQCALDNRLHWDELEDIQFSQIGNLLGWFYYLDVNNNVYTFSDRIKEAKMGKSMFLYRIKNLIFIKFIIVRLLNFSNHFLNLYFKKSI